MREWLIKIRDTKGLTQLQVATDSGISRSYYSGIEIGSRNASPKAAKAIARTLGFNWTAFFDQNGLEMSQKEVG
ncbi:MAG: xre family transcriptional regulator [Bacilli bacterium]|nr:xre family transcriptional regulator [Bacilli bacterium]